MIFDSSVKNVIDSAYENKTDVFLRMNPPEPLLLISDFSDTAVFLPGSFYTGDEPCFYDIRRLGDEDFRKSLLESKIRRIVTLFSECADKSEYGYRESFGWIGEMRAEAARFIQIVAFLSPCSDSLGICAGLFGSPDVVVLGEKAEPDFNAFKAVSEKAKFYQTAELVERYAYGRSVVYFNSREEALSFSRFLCKRGTACSCIDGATSGEELKNKLTAFYNGSVNILVATKSYIPSSLFYPPERVFFCGAPFSLSHIARCGCALKSEKPFVVYCEDDVKRNEKIIASFSEKLADGEISGIRIARLNEMCKMLNIKEKL